MTTGMRILFIVAVQTMVIVSMVGMKQWTLNTGTPILLDTKPIDPRSLFRGDYVILRYDINELRLADLEGDNVFKKNDSVYVVLKQVEKYWKPVSVHSKRPAAEPDQVVIKGKVYLTPVAATRHSKYESWAYDEKIVISHETIHEYIKPGDNIQVITDDFVVRMSVTGYEKDKLLVGIDDFSGQPIKIAIDDIEELSIRKEIYKDAQTPDALYPTSQHIHVSYGIENYFVPEGEGRKLESLTGDQTLDIRVSVDRFGNAAIHTIFVDGQEWYRETLF